MSFQIKRGTNSQRLGYTAASGELIYATDTKILYVGDGTTPGGVTVGTVASVGASAGVSSINGLSGAVVFSAGSGLTLTISGNTLTFASTGAVSGITNYVESINGSTGVITNAAFLNIPQTFTSVQNFSNGISGFGATFTNKINIKQISIDSGIDDSVIKIGKNSGPSSTAPTFLISLGTDSLSSLNDATNLSNIAIGYQAGMCLGINSTNNVLLGDFNASGVTLSAASVLVGSGIQFNCNSSLTDSVLLGSGIKSNAGGAVFPCTNSVLVGGSICSTSGGGTCQNNVYLGYGILNTTTTVNGSSNIIVGSRVLNPMSLSSFTGSNSIMLGTIDNSQAYSNNKSVEFPFRESFQLLIASGLTSWIYGNRQGNILLGDATVVGRPVEKLHVQGNIYAGGTYIYIANSSTPASAGASGTTGAIAWDSNFLYVCVGTDTWKRTGLTTW